ncbi:MAG TPA: hypothetical protein VET89_01060, partial [Stellaceae bacterium]|nr:hypothetical protein [Stellaceae bacterium]
PEKSAQKRNKLLSMLCSEIMVNKMVRQEAPMNAIIRMLAVSVIVTASLALPAMAAPAAGESATGDTISFAQYRDWRLHFIEQRQTQIAAELAEKEVTAERRAGLERQKAYYDFFAAMPTAERDRRFRERFDQIDANHDGIVDRAERAAWHDKQRAFYQRRGSYHSEARAGDTARR